MIRLEIAQPTTIATTPNPSDAYRYHRSESVNFSSGASPPAAAASRGRPIAAPMRARIMNTRPVNRDARFDSVFLASDI